ncbi:Fic family protein [Sulfurimonas autotrophica]|uniref:Filamentation induced by cAMP protein Fic n=1 Tax=Sulfurimonas autotrophica (strain ATCC BAA-671 / DSM 16294 / JCM 11897 / OK10) TaxID=563040 RepID=E0US53_SULAO|nr:Fic family protein [Sulfurimonas autotrophica]ADN09076.1 filamentation induced by cAMP protein Fic [Sulfurimonas autotrophica DSM 16294]
MNYAPPFKITTKIIDLISKISLNIGKLEVIDSSSTLPLLRKVNQIRTITGTLQIEGSSLDEERITALIEGKRVLGKVDEIAEANGAIALYKQIDNLNYKDEQELLKSHKVLMDELLKNAGTYRTKDVGVGGEGGVVHVAPPNGHIPKLMSDLFDWLSTTDEHPLIVSSVFHYEFEFIHPFIDGNGRMGRFWQSLILYNWNNYFSVIPIESIIRDKQQEYYNVLEECGSSGESTLFIEFALQSILEAIDKVGNRVSNKVGNLTDNQQMILEQIQLNNKISASKLSDIVGISKRKIEENLAKLKEQGILQRVGGTRGYWELLAVI